MTLSGFPIYIRRLLRLWPAHSDLLLKMSSGKQVVLGIKMKEKSTMKISQTNCKC